MTKSKHNEAGHVNVYQRDHDSVITGYGKHDRVIAFLPDGRGLHVRVDHKWQLGEPTTQQILRVARRDQGVRGRWKLATATKADDGHCTWFDFTRA